MVLKVKTENNIFKTGIGILKRNRKGEIPVYKVKTEIEIENVKYWYIQNENQKRNFLKPVFQIEIEIRKY